MIKDTTNRIKKPIIISPIKYTYQRLISEIRLGLTKQLNDLGRYKYNKLHEYDGLIPLFNFLDRLSPSSLLGNIFSNNHSKAWVENNKIINTKNENFNTVANTAIDIIAPFSKKLTITPAKNYANNVTKRGIEVAMRTTTNPNPGNALIEGIKTIDKSRLRSIGKYIVTGKKTGEKGYYNSLAKNPEHYNDGIYRDLNDLWYSNLQHSYIKSDKDDLIDAFVFGKDIDPSYGYKKLSSKNYGIHTDYINKNYPNKNIPIYEVRTNYTYNGKRVQPKGKIVPIKEYGAHGDDIFDPNTERLAYTFDKGPLNTGGHIRVFGLDSKKNPFIMGLDIWKFNPSDYKSKWLNNNPFNYYEHNKHGEWVKNQFKTKIVNKILNKGLEMVDKNTTPVVIRSKWIPYRDYAFRYNDYKGTRPISSSGDLSILTKDMMAEALLRNLHKVLVPKKKHLYKNPKIGVLPITNNITDDVINKLYNLFN